MQSPCFINVWIFQNICWTLKTQNTYTSILHFIKWSSNMLAELSIICLQRWHNHPSSDTFLPRIANRLQVSWNKKIFKPRPICQYWKIINNKHYCWSSLKIIMYLELCWDTKTHAKTNYVETMHGSIQLWKWSHSPKHRIKHGNCNGGSVEEVGTYFETWY